MRAVCAPRRVVGPVIAPQATVGLRRAPQRPGGVRRPSMLVLVAATLLLLTGGWAVAVPAGASIRAGAVGSVAAQDATSTTLPCDDGTPGPSAAPGADGPAPVGRCEPTAGQKAMDNLVWLFLALVLFGGLAGLAWLQRTAVRRARAEGDARDAAAASLEAPEADGGSEAGE